eukprot:GHVR01121542.1.p1 GENE.GHVR01121542.1~~GHVR01121542.1.p1  ORF type:complete len:268 (+),score=65.18 GHVR01121542.1:95-898(+)
MKKFQPDKHKFVSSRIPRYPKKNEIIYFSLDNLPSHDMNNVIMIWRGDDLLGKDINWLIHERLDLPRNNKIKELWKPTDTRTMFCPSASDIEVSKLTTRHEAGELEGDDYLVLSRWALHRMGVGEGGVVSDSRSHIRTTISEDKAERDLAGRRLDDMILLHAFHTNQSVDEDKREQLRMDLLGHTHTHTPTIADFDSEGLVLSQIFARLKVAPIDYEPAVVIEVYRRMVQRLIKGREDGGANPPPSTFPGNGRICRGIFVARARVSG